MKESAIAAIYAAWFREDEWDEIQSMSVGLPHSYSEWNARAVETLNAFEQQGYVIQKVILTAADIRRDFEMRGEQIDGQRRQELAVIIGDQRESKGH